MPNYIPRSDSQFHEWQDNLMNYLAATYTIFNVPLVEWTAIAALHTDFNQKYSLSVHPDTRTTVSVLAKNGARRRLEHNLRMFLKSYITYNPLVTHIDKRGMGLPIHDKKPTPIPIPATIPVAIAEVSSIGVIVIHFRDSEKTGKAKPYGIRGAEIKWAILDSPPLNWEDLIHSSFSTHTPCTLSFQRSQRGKQLYYALRWENTRGEKGHWCEIMNTIIA
jgi:hypothetical protein